MATATFQIWRGDRESGGFKDYTTPVTEGMVVLDAIHQIQAEQASDLAVRWNERKVAARSSGMIIPTRTSSLPR